VDISTKAIIVDLPWTARRGVQLMGFKLFVLVVISINKMHGFYFWYSFI